MKLLGYEISEVHFVNSSITNLYNNYKSDLTNLNYIKSINNISNISMLIERKGRITGNLNIRKNSNSYYINRILFYLNSRTNLAIPFDINYLESPLAEIKENISELKWRKIQNTENLKSVYKLISKPVLVSGLIKFKDPETKKKMLNSSSNSFGISFYERHLFFEDADRCDAICINNHKKMNIDKSAYFIDLAKKLSNAKIPYDLDNVNQLEEIDFSKKIIIKFENFSSTLDCYMKFQNYVTMNRAN